MKGIGDINLTWQKKVAVTVVPKSLMVSETGFSVDLKAGLSTLRHCGDTNSPIELWVWPVISI